jgi:hypothetical protein
MAPASPDTARLATGGVQVAAVALDASIDEFVDSSRADFVSAPRGLGERNPPDLFVLNSSFLI